MQYCHTCIYILNRTPTVNCEVHSTKLQWPHNLPLHVPLVVDEERGKVTVGVVGYARGRNTLQELCGRELCG